MSGDKTPDGRGEIVFAQWASLAVATDVLAAPGAGFRWRLLAFNCNGTGGTLTLRDSSTSTVQFNASSVSTGRPIAHSLSPEGLAVFSENEAINLNTGVSCSGSITVVRERVP